MLRTRTRQTQPRACGLEVCPPRQAAAAPLSRLWEPVDVRCAVAAKRKHATCTDGRPFFVGAIWVPGVAELQNAGISRPDKFAEEKKGWCTAARAESQPEGRRRLAFPTWLTYPGWKPKRFWYGWCTDRHSRPHPYFGNMLVVAEG